MQVFTTKGLIEMSQLTVRDVVELSDNCRKILCQYYLGDELVRQSVFIDMLRPMESTVSQGVIGGQ